MASIALLGIALFSAASCAQKKQDAWVSPADDASLARLESATLERDVSKARRARLFFLWGQELAAKGEDERAIGAFERVVDLRSGLVDESRFNLEILWRRERERKQQDQQEKQDQQSPQDKQDKQNAGDNGGDQKNDSRKKADEKSAQEKKGEQGKDGQDKRQAAQQKDETAPKDLSGLVRDREQSSDLDKALKAELERRNEKQQAESGGVAPVEKDW
jgi:hypothetical protein